MAPCYKDKLSNICLLYCYYKIYYRIIQLLLISIKKDDKNRFRDAIDSATFSSSELNISTLLSVFTSLWIRSEMEKQNIIKQTYFRIFKEPQLKDENYKRKWFFENAEKQQYLQNKYIK